MLPSLATVAWVMGAYAVSVVSIEYLRRWALRARFLDLPNARSSHAVPKPRNAGWAIGLLTLTGAAVLAPWDSAEASILGAWWMGALAVFAIGLWDDVRNLPSLPRLLLQFAVAFPVAWMAAQGAEGILAQWVPWEPLRVALVAIWIVGLTNGYNFMDGIDGIAGAQGLVAALGWMLIALLGGWVFGLQLSLLLVAVLAGFLVHNWAPSRIFMGDAGSGFLGFTFACWPLLAHQGLPGHDPTGWVAIGALFVWPFLADTSFTILHRLRRRENILRAHRSHLYQRMTQCGLSHSSVTLTYSLLAVSGVTGGCLFWTNGIQALLYTAGPVVILFLILWRVVKSLERHHREQVPGPRA